MQHADGEIKAARAAEAFGVPFTLSTMSINSIEDVAAATTKPFWFQLYTMKDQGFVSSLIQRAKDANCSALVITLDLQVLGQRHKDIKNGLSAPPKPTLANMINLATKWRWGMGMMKASRREFGNIVGHVEGVSDAADLGAWTAEQFDPTLDWDKVAKIKEEWGGKVILKGIIDPEDAKWRLRSAPMRSWCRTMAGANSTARFPRSARFRASWMRWATPPRCISTAASAPGRTC